MRTTSFHLAYPTNRGQTDSKEALEGAEPQSCRPKWIDNITTPSIAPSSAGLGQAALVFQDGFLSKEGLEGSLLPKEQERLLWSSQMGRMDIQTLGWTYGPLGGVGECILSPLVDTCLQTRPGVPQIPPQDIH